MKKVSKKTQDRIADLFSQLDDAAGEIECAVSNYNAAAYELNEIRAEVAAEIETYIDERSDRWQESERGETYAEWLNSWEEETEEVDEPCCDHGDVDDLVYEVADLG